MSCEGFSLALSSSGWTLQTLLWIHSPSRVCLCDCRVEASPVPAPLIQRRSLPPPRCFLTHIRCFSCLRTYLSQIQVTCPPSRVSKEQPSLKSFPGMSRKEDKQGLPSHPWLGFYPCSLSTWCVPRAVPVFSKHMLCTQGSSRVL